MSSSAYLDSAKALYQFKQAYDAVNPTHPYQLKSEADRISYRTAQQYYSTTFFSKLFWRFYALTGSSPSSIGPPGTDWGSQIGTPGTYLVNEVLTTTIGQTNNLGLVAKGYYYSPIAGKIQLRTVTTGGVQVFFNKNLVISNWASHTSATDTSAVLDLPQGYTPIEIRYYNITSDFALQLLTSVNSGGYTTPVDVLYNTGVDREV